MSTGREDPSADGISERFISLQPLRGLESNWGVDLAKYLENYLLKICSGELSAEDSNHLSVNFAEAALLLQGSVQVYSRKVEYLYSLVLHALEFISQKRDHQQAENAPDGDEAAASHSARVGEEDDDLFWCPDDVPVEPKNCLEETGDKANGSHFAKAPPNLVVLEGDCLDNSGDGELESYVLATNDIYEDFILLDPIDAPLVRAYGDQGRGRRYQGDEHGTVSPGTKARKSFQSPPPRSAMKSPQLRKTEGRNFLSPPLPSAFRSDTRPEPSSYSDTANEFGAAATTDGDSDEDDDPWKPLNPHERGTLKVKPFKRVKFTRKQEASSERQGDEFPLAKLHGGPVSSELAPIWNERRRRRECLPLYEKLRQSLVDTNAEAQDHYFCSSENNDGESSEANDFVVSEMREPAAADHNDSNVGADPNSGGGPDDRGVSTSQKTLEDLCNSHLDSLLASIADTEKQTELAARVATWKQNIEKNLEEQDSHPPFDMHRCGDLIMERLESGMADADAEAMSFSDIVAGQLKHDVARCFSALLQLVNNGDVELDRGRNVGKLVCHARSNPFYVRLLRRTRHRNRSAKKRPKCRDTAEKGGSEVESAGKRISGFTRLQRTCKFSVKVAAKGGGTPGGKRRRRADLVEAAELDFTDDVSRDVSH